MIYFITPNYSLAFIPKSGCSTLSRCVIKAFQPTEESLIENADFPEGKNANNSMWQTYVLREKYPSKPILAMIRDPVERFRSAVSQFKTNDVDSIINSLINNTAFDSGGKRRKQIIASKNRHFMPQILWVDVNTKLYKFPEHINEAAAEIGFILPLPQINAASYPKPTLTAEQTAVLEEYYAEDIALFESIVSPGIITGVISANPVSLVPPVIPDDEEP
jgi:hypothetical protein